MASNAIIPNKPNLNLRDRKVIGVANPDDGTDAVNLDHLNNEVDARVGIEEFAGAEGEFSNTANQTFSPTFLTYTHPDPFTFDTDDVGSGIDFRIHSYSALSSSTTAVETGTFTYSIVAETDITTVVYELGTADISITFGLDEVFEIPASTLTAGTPYLLRIDASAIVNTSLTIITFWSLAFDGHVQVKPATKDYLDLHYGSIEEVRTNSDNRFGTPVVDGGLLTEFNIGATTYTLGGSSDVTGAGFQQQPIGSGNIDIPANGGLINSQGTRAWVNISGDTINVSFSDADSSFVATDWLELTDPSVELSELVIVDDVAVPFDLGSTLSVDVNGVGTLGGTTPQDVYDQIVTDLATADADADLDGVFVTYEDIEIGRTTNGFSAYRIQSVIDRTAGTIQLENFDETPYSGGVKVAARIETFIGEYDLRTTITSNYVTLSGNTTITGDLEITDGTDTITITPTDSLGDTNQNAFSNIAVTGQTTVEADATTDTLTLVGAGGTTITTDDTTDTVTITSASAITVQDGGDSLTTPAETLNFEGDGVTATGDGATKTITITGGGIAEAIDNINESETTDIKIWKGTIQEFTDRTGDELDPNAIYITTDEVPDSSDDTFDPETLTGDISVSGTTVTVTDDSHNHVISNVDGLQTALDSKPTVTLPTTPSSTTEYNLQVTSSGAATFVEDDGGGSTDFSLLSTNPLNYGVGAINPIRTQISWEDSSGDSFIGNADNIIRSSEFDNITTTGTEVGGLFPSILIEEVPLATYTDWTTADADTFPGYIGLQELTERGRSIIVEITSAINGSTADFRDVTCEIIEVADIETDNTTANIVIGYTINHDGIEEIPSTSTIEWNVIEIADARRTLTHIIQNDDETLEVTTDITIGRQLAVGSVVSSRTTGDTQFTVLADHGDLTSTSNPTAGSIIIGFSTSAPNDIATIQTAFDGATDLGGSLYFTTSDTSIVVSDDVITEGTQNRNFYRVIGVVAGFVQFVRAVDTTGTGLEATDATGSNADYTFFTAVENTPDEIIFIDDVAFRGAVTGPGIGAPDQTYMPDSVNAQSGTAVAEAVEGAVTDVHNRLHSLEANQIPHTTTHGTIASSTSSATTANQDFEGPSAVLYDARLEVGGGLDRFQCSVANANDRWVEGDSIAVRFDDTTTFFGAVHRDDRLDDDNRLLEINFATSDHAAIRATATATETVGSVVAHYWNASEVVLFTTTLEAETEFTGPVVFDDITLPDDSVDIADLSAGGNASATTFLRGDNTWATPTGGTSFTAVTQISEIPASPNTGDRMYINSSNDLSRDVGEMTRQPITASGTNVTMVWDGGSAYQAANATFGEISRCTMSSNISDIDQMITNSNGAMVTYGSLELTSADHSTPTVPGTLMFITEDGANEFRLGTQAGSALDATVWIHGDQRTILASAVQMFHPTLMFQPTETFIANTFYTRVGDLWIQE